jgi:membrane protein
VKWWAALTGSFFTALLFEVAQRLYVTFQVKASTNAAIYGALAAIPLLLLWIYTAWTVVLFGAELTASIQHGPSEFRVDEPSHTFKRFAVVLIVMRIAERMRNLRGPVTPDSLAKELGITKNALGMTLGNLIKSGLVIEAVEGQDAEDDRGLFLSRDPATITLYDALAFAGLESDLEVSIEPRLGELLEKVESSEREILTHVTVADLVASHQDDGHQRVGNGLGVATQN